MRQERRKGSKEARKREGKEEGELERRGSRGQEGRKTERM